MDPQKPSAGTDRYPDADGASVRTRAGEVWLRRDGILHLVGFPEMDHDAGVAREVIEAQVRAAGGTKRPILVDLRRIRSMTHEARLRYAGPENAAVLLAAALLVESPASRVIGRFFLGVVKPLFPTALFESEAPALEWLRTFLPLHRSGPGETLETRCSQVWLGEDGILRYQSRLNAEETLPDAQENIAAGERLARGVKRPALVDIRRIHSMEREARLYYAGPETARIETAAALLVSSAFSRIIGNLFMGANKPVIPTRLFTVEQEAVEWLKQFLPSGEVHGSKSR